MLMRILSSLVFSLTLAACAPLVSQPAGLAEELPSKVELQTQQTLVQTRIQLMGRTRDYAHVLDENAQLWTEKLQAQGQQLSEQLKAKGEKK